MEDWVFELIESMWVLEPAKRISCQEIVDTLLDHFSFELRESVIARKYGISVDKVKQDKMKNQIEEKKEVTLPKDMSNVNNDFDMKLSEHDKSDDSEKDKESALSTEAKEDSKSDESSGG